MNGKLLELVKRHHLIFAWIVSIVAFCGSLYFSEVMGYIPCNLCWYQRICMYPLVLILGMAIYKNDSFIYPYVISLSGVGMAISLFHYLEQKMWEENSLFCQTGAPCKVEYINWFGFITIPLLAFIGFTLILSLMLTIIRR